MALRKSRPRRLTCGCCGESAIGRQYWNHDTGWGLCKKCAHRFDEMIAAGKPGVAEELAGYGVRGYHFDLAGAAEDGADDKFRCPECGHDRVLYVEDISSYRVVNGVDVKSGKVEVDGLYKTDNGFDEEGTNQRFQCSSCCHQWPCPADDKIDFV